jgi:hypothetical protein
VVGLVGAATDEIPVLVVVVLVAFAVLVIAGAGAGAGADDDVAVDSADGGNERAKEEVPLLVGWFFLFERALLGCPHWDQRVASMDAYSVTYC